MISDLALWERLQNYDLDAADAVFPFSQRLARDNGWSHSFTRSVIEDYKKFVYLMCIADQALTPSDEIDQVWHLHLIYTRDYWGEFCPNVLGRMIHHGPTRGGDAQTRSFKAAYEETLRLYEREFGVPPPKAIWPESGIRFTRPLNIKRIDLSSVYVLPKWQVFLCLGGAATLLLGACKVGSVEVPKAVVGGLPFFIILAIAFIVIVSSASKKRGKGDGDGGGCGGGSSGCNGNGSWWGSSGQDGGSDGGDGGSDGGSGCGGGCGGGGD